MRVLRSTFLPADHDGSLTLRGILTYDDMARLNNKMEQQLSINFETNKFLKQANLSGFEQNQKKLNLIKSLEDEIFSPINIGRAFSPLAMSAE